MDLDKLKKNLEDSGQPKFRLKQIAKAVYQDGVSSFSEITNLPKFLREKLDSEFEILSFLTEEVLESEDKKSAKALLKMKDGNFVETVLMSPKPGFWSVCVSSQIGCPLGCGFCATGRGGFKRNLSAEEISDQVLFWGQYLAKSRIKSDEREKEGAVLSGVSESGAITNIVFMGMGEPFLNWEEIRKSLKMLIDKKMFGFGSRSISISTAGIPEGIEKMSREFPQVNLAISLHFASDEKRSKFMPVNRRYGLNDLGNSLKSYLLATNRKLFVEYILFSGINDSFEDARALAKYLRSIGKIHLVHVNLIRYNFVSGELISSSREKTAKFKDYLLKRKIDVTIRKSLGEDIQGACGQLAGKERLISKIQNSGGRE